MTDGAGDGNWILLGGLLAIVCGPKTPHYGILDSRVYWNIQGYSDRKYANGAREARFRVRASDALRRTDVPLPFF